MALTATMFRFELELSDVDRGVYETLELRVAQHPSESDAFMVTRVLAMALEYRDGLEFGRGVCVPDDPPLSAPNAMGGVALWIEIGRPSADRLHKVAKQTDELRVYTHKSPTPLMDDLASGQIYRGDDIVVVALDPTFIDALGARLSRNNKWAVLRSHGELYVTIDDDTFQTVPAVAQVSEQRS